MAVVTVALAHRWLFNADCGWVATHQSLQKLLDLAMRHVHGDTINAYVCAECYHDGLPGSTARSALQQRCRPVVGHIVTVPVEGLRWR